MYPWLRVMYAVVVIGSRIRRSACGMNLSTFCPCAHAVGTTSAVAATRPITAVIERSSAVRLLIVKSPRTKADNEVTRPGFGGIMPHPGPGKVNVGDATHT